MGPRPDLRATSQVAPRPAWGPAADEGVCPTSIHENSEIGLNGIRSVPTRLHTAQRFVFTTRALSRPIRDGRRKRADQRLSDPTSVNTASAGSLISATPFTVLTGAIFVQFSSRVVT